MALQFIIGRSGSGKSTLLYEKIIKESLEHPKQNYFLIVPDQFTLDTQKTLIAMHPFHGTMNIDIISFHRLAYKVFRELAKDPGVILEDLGKTMALSRILGKNADRLPLFGKSRGKLGFVDELKSLISEFYQYRITRQMLLLQKEKEEENSILWEKLSELALIMEEFETFMGQDYIVAEQLLSALGDRAWQSELLKGSVICLDGFTGFTPVQYELLAKLLPLSSMMYVTVTMDEGEASFHKILDYELFCISKETISAMRRIAAECKTKILPNWLVFGGESRFSKNPELAFLEKNIFRQRHGIYKGKTKHLTVHHLTDPEEEAVFAARTISKLIRDGYRYRDIAVVSGDMERYSMRLSRVFEDFGIPCFVDAAKGMKSHPMVECVRGLFALAEYDYNYDSICHYMKTGMTDILKNEADALDNYLLATGIRGFHSLAEAFSLKPKNMPEHLFCQAESARKQLMSETGELMGMFRQKKGMVEEYLRALVSYLIHMGCEEKLNREQERFLEEQKPVLAMAYSQVYPKLLRLFDKIYDILGKEEMELCELRKIMDAGLDEMELGTVPPGIDQVIIGDTERTRLNQVKVVFFLGVNEGIVPKPAKGGGILSDIDRENLEGSLALAPGVKKSASMEQFYLYLNMTKPSDALYLTLSQVDEEGKSIRPSYLIGRLMLLFPKLTIVKGGDMEKRHYYTIPSSLGYIREGISRFLADAASPEDEAFLGWLFGNTEGKKWILYSVKGRFYTNEEAPLSFEAAKALYGLHMESSISRLEKYKSCAFAHFLRYGLMLFERQRCKIRPLDLGQILHRCLELFFRELKVRAGGFSFSSDLERDRLAVECLRTAVEEYGSFVFHSSARNEACIDRMERLVKRTVWALLKQIAKGDFTPEQFEWRFHGKETSDAAYFPLSHGGSLSLAGVVDRIDYYEEGEELYLKIIDYKSGMQAFSLEDIYHGLSLQLIVYMNAAIEGTTAATGKKTVPGGIFYFHIKDPFVAEMPDEDAAAQMEKEFALSGLVLAEKEIVMHMDREGQKSIPAAFLKNGDFSAGSSIAGRDQFHALGSYVKKEIALCGNEILNGNIAIAPYRTEKRTACDYCDYKDVCGFDTAFFGNRYRKFGKIKKEDIWERIERENG